MTRLLVRHALLLAVAFAASWWVVFHDPPQVVPRRLQAPEEIRVALENLAPDAAPTTPPESQADAPKSPDRADLTAQEPPSGPPPPESGSPLAEEQDRPRTANPVPETADPDATADPEAAESPSGTEPTALMADPSLLAAAALELEGRGRKGFTTQLIAAPEDQLEIAHAFGEELVLIPYRSVAPEAQDRSWFRITGDGAPRVERVSTPPPLSSYRQYRDLFDYEYSRLPPAVRELRRAVLSRNEVYVFAALIPPREWALVIGRRRQALRWAGRSEEDVSTFRIRYRRTADAGFDVEVIEITFSDGSRFRPSGGARGSGTDTNQHSLGTEESQ